MFYIIISVSLAIIYANFIEWILHKYVLHHLGKDKSSPWSFHWHRHHMIVRKSRYEDPDYLVPIKNWTEWKNGQGKEIFSLLLLCVIHLPLVFFLPIVYATLVAYSFIYFIIHKYSHVYPHVGYKYFRWHFDHHCGIDQNQNWCVTFPLADYVLKTRIKYSYKFNSSGDIIEVDGKSRRVI